MIAIIIVMVICLTVIIKTILTIRKDNRRIEELEQTLEDYYKRREQKLMKHEKDQTNANKTIEIGRERLKIIIPYSRFLI